MIFYLFVVDLGLNGHDVVSVHTEQIDDPQAKFDRWNAAFSDNGMMRPYTTGYAVWRVDTETGSVEEVIEG